jgi:succinate dehydrogenase hydrophobic anchor subunit
VTAEAGRPNRATAAFGVAATVVILFNTVLACVKDANPALLRFMNSIAGHNWTTQGLVDLVLFFGLGLVAMRTGWTDRITGQGLAGLLTAAVVLASVALATWYLLF